MPERNIRLGLVGAGRWGKCYINTIAMIEGVELSVVVSSNPNTKMLVPINCSVISDWSLLLNNELDGVIIATPTDAHVEIALFFLEKNVPVLLEKPVSNRFIETEKLLSFCTNHKKKLMVDYIYHYHPGFLKLRDLVKVGVNAGDSIESIKFTSGQAGPFRKDASVIRDWLVHDIAMLFFLVEGGDIQNVFVERLKGTVGNIYRGNFAIQFKTAGNIPVHIVLGNLYSKKNRMVEVFFSSGRKLLFDPINHSEKILNLDASGSEEVAIKNQIMPLNNVVEQFCGLIDSITIDNAYYKAINDIESSVDQVDYMAISRGV